MNKRRRLLAGHADSIHELFKIPEKGGLVFPLEVVPGWDDLKRKYKAVNPFPPFSAVTWFSSPSLVPWTEMSRKSTKLMFSSSRPRPFFAEEEEEDGGLGLSFLFAGCCWDESGGPEGAGRLAAPRAAS